MKYLGKITDPKDLVTKEYVDGGLSDKLDKANPTGTGTFIMNDNSAGAKGWNWQQAELDRDVNPKVVIFRGESFDNISVGDRISIKAGYSWNFFGTVTYVGGSGIAGFNAQVNVAMSSNANIPENFDPANHVSDGYFWLPDKPNAGVFTIGESATALGTSNKANEIGSLVIGKRNLADGRYSFVAGTDNEGGYATLVQGDTNKVHGICSMAVGQQNIVSGSTSGSIGYGNNVSGDESVALGKQNAVSGSYALAEGSNGTASGNYSHVEGYGAEATNVCAHAEGDSTHATGVASHAEGYNTRAQGIRSHAEGQDSQALGAYSHAQGLGSVADRDNQSVRGRYNSRFDKYNFVDVVGWGEGDNSRKNLFALSTSGNIRLKGDVYVGSDNDSNGGTKLAKVTDIPDISGKMDKVNPEGSGTFSFGTDVEALSTSSIAQGSQTTAGGKAFTIVAVGGTNSARILTLDSTEGLIVSSESPMLASAYMKDVDDAHTNNFDAFGNITAINGNNVTFSGGFNWAWTLDAEQSSHLWIVGHPELGTRIIGEYAIVLGRDNIAQNEQTVVTGRQNIAAGKYAVVNGRQNKGIGYSTHVEGRGNTVKGMYASADGRNHTVGANYARAIGYNNEAIGLAAFAEGSGTHATHEGAHTEGLQTRSGNAYQHVAGRYNVQKSGLARVTGWGSKNGNTITPKNIEELDTEGNLYLSGNKLQLGTAVLQCDEAHNEFEFSVNKDALSIVPTQDGIHYGYIISSDATYGRPVLSIEELSSVEIFPPSEGEEGEVIPGTYEVMATPINIRVANPTSSDEATNKYYVDTALAAKVDKVTGKGLSTNDYTDAEKAQLAGIANKMDKANPTGTGSFSLNRKANTTIGKYSFAEGFNATASGDYSHAEGHFTKAQSYYTHAEGYNTTASLDASHAEGSFTIAVSHNSHAQGEYTIAQRKDQMALGKYNVADTSGSQTTLGAYAEIVGNGTADNARSNARTLDWNGNERLMGDVYVGCAANSTGGNKVATEAYVDSKSHSLLLWTNPNQSAGMGAATVTFDTTVPSNRSGMLVVEFAMTSTSNEFITFTLPFESFASGTKRYNVIADYSAFNADSNARGRQIVALDANSIRFGTGYQNGTTNAARIVPTRIWFIG